MSLGNAAALDVTATLRFPAVFFVHPVAVKGFLDTGLWAMNSVMQPAVGARRSSHAGAERVI